MKKVHSDAITCASPHRGDIHWRFGHQSRIHCVTASFCQRYHSAVIHLVT